MSTAGQEYKSRSLWTSIVYFAREKGHNILFCVSLLPKRKNLIVFYLLSPLSWDAFLNCMLSFRMSESQVIFARAESSSEDIKFATTGDPN